MIRMFASSDSASRPWIAFKSCANSKVYSALSALDFAVTVDFSIVNDISLNELDAHHLVLQQKVDSGHT